MKASLTFPVRLLRGETRLLVRFAVSSIGQAALTAASILLIRDFLAGVLGQREGLAAWAAETWGDNGVLWALAAILLLAHLGATALAYVSRIDQQRIVKVIELKTMERLIQRLLGLSVGFFDRRTTGDLIETVRRDVSHMRMVAMAGANIAIESFHALGLIAAALFLSPWLSLWAFLLLPLAVGPVFVIARRALARSYGVRRKGVVLFDGLLELLRGIRVVKIYQAERSEEQRTVERARGYFEELIQMERVRAASRVVLESLGGLSLVVVIIVGGFQVLAGELSWPELLAFLVAARAARVPLNALNTSYIDIQRHGASLDHIAALLAEDPDIRDRPDALPLDAPPSELAARHVSFQAGGKRLLDDVSFEVRAGETLGIVGPSGAGKTTLLNLLARFYDPSSGAILLNGVELDRLRLADVHAALALITQDPVVFRASIGDNIRYGRRSASQAEIVAAARDAEIHDVIQAMPEGYDTPIGQGGRALSFGEMQRVNIARAVLKNAPILLLDEATSGLDSHAEVRVQRALDRLAAERMTIVVAHRLSTLRHAPRILVLDGGRAVGLGPHEQLLKGCATYRRLWEAQAADAVGDGARWLSASRGAG